MTARALLALLTFSVLAEETAEAQRSSPTGPAAPVVTWERLPYFARDPFTLPPLFSFIGFLPATDPARPGVIAGHDLYAFSDSYGYFVYAPGHGHPDWGDWQQLRLSSPDGAVLTTEGTIIGNGSFDVERSDDRGVTWDPEAYDGTSWLVYQSSLPQLQGPSGHGAVVAVPGRFCTSLDDGRRGTWSCQEARTGRVHGAAEVPPSDALPGGRTLFGVDNGIVYSDDLGKSWQQGAGAYAPGAGQGLSFAIILASESSHGVVVLAGITDFTEPDDDRQAVVVRSDDGGASWRLIWRYDPDVWGAGTGEEPQEMLYGPDGAVWLSVGFRAGAGPWPGRVLRSTDLGATWEAADTGLDRYFKPSYAPGPGVLIEHWTAGPDGRLWAATSSGVWRTEAPVFAVAGEDEPEDRVGIGLRVWPNPASDEATVSLALPAPGTVRVSAVDVLGREVAVVWDGPARDDLRVEVATEGWPAGTYVIRAVSAAGTTATTGLTVAR